MAAKINIKRSAIEEANIFTSHSARVWATRHGPSFGLRLTEDPIPTDFWFKAVDLREVAAFSIQLAEDLEKNV